MPSVSPIPIKAKFLVPLLIVGDIFFGFTSASIGPIAHFAHLGGSLFGFLYVSNVSNKELNLLDGFFNLFKSKKKPLRTVYKAPKKSEKNDNQQKIDSILDKISKSGYDSLTKAEKEFLFKQGKS